jgi:hypothetical protein
MKIAIEHIIGVIIGLAPIVIIAVVFRNDDAMCMYYLKQYVAIMGTISTFAIII